MGCYSKRRRRRRRRRKDPGLRDRLKNQHKPTTLNADFASHSEEIGYFSYLSVLCVVCYYYGGFDIESIPLQFSNKHGLSYFYFRFN